MTITGNSLKDILLLFLIVFGLLDLLCWLIGKETLSQHIIRRSKEDKSYAVITLLLVLLGSAWLIAHWELLEIVFYG